MRHAQLDLREAGEERPPTHADLQGDDAENLLQLAIESSSSGVLIVGPAGTLALANREAERQFGYAREELVGQPVALLLPEGLSLRHAKEADHFSSGAPARPLEFTRELFGRRKDGSETPLTIGLHPILTDRGVFVVISIVDLTERRRSANALTAADAEWLHFEQLVGELSVRFIDLPPTDVATAIQEAQRRIVEALDLDRSTLLPAQR